MFIMLEIKAETKSQDNKNQVGNKRLQVGNKGGRRLETKKTKSSEEIPHSQNIMTMTQSKYYDNITVRVSYRIILGKQTIINTFNHS